MNLFTTAKKSASAILFIVIVIGVFWLMQKKVTDNLIYCTLISIMIAVALTFFQSKFIADALERTESLKNAKIEAKGLRARYKRLEEKVQKLTAELEAANLKLKTEIADKPLDQRQLQQRLKNLNCLYALSKIVNRHTMPYRSV